MVRPKEQQKYQITNFLMNKTTNHDMTGVVIPDGHIFYDVELTLYKEPLLGA